MKKVLLGCPVNINKKYALDVWIPIVKSFDYANYSIYLSDNSPKKEVFQTYKEDSGLVIEAIERPENQIVDSTILLRDSHNKVFQYALNNGYDYLFHLECDVFPPFDVIKRLLSHNLPIVHGLIHHGIGKNSYVQVLDIFPKENHAAHYFSLKRNLGISDLLFMDGRLKTSYNVGLACSMINVKFIHNLLGDNPFRCVQGENFHPDTYFANDLFDRGVMNYVDTSILCIHENKSWGTILDHTYHIDNALKSK